MSKQAYSKAKGRDGENSVVAFLRSLGIKAERRRLTGTLDCGDISGWHLVTVEVKARAKYAPSEWLDEAVEESANADKKFHDGVKGYHLVVAKRRGETDTAKWFSLMTFEQSADLIERSKRLEAIDLLNQMQAALEGK